MLFTQNFINSLYEFKVYRVRRKIDKVFLLNFFMKIFFLHCTSFWNVTEKSQQTVITFFIASYKKIQPERGLQLGILLIFPQNIWWCRNQHLFLDRKEGGAFNRLQIWIKSCSVFLWLSIISVYNYVRVIWDKGNQQGEMSESLPLGEDRSSTRSFVLMKTGPAGLQTGVIRGNSVFNVINTSKIHFDLKISVDSLCVTLQLELMLKLKTVIWNRPSVSGKAHSSRWKELAWTDFDPFWPMVYGQYSRIWYHVEDHSLRNTVDRKNVCKISHYLHFMISSTK